MNKDATGTTNEIQISAGIVSLQKYNEDILSRIMCLLPTQGFMIYLNKNDYVSWYNVLNGTLNYYVYK